MYILKHLQYLYWNNHLIASENYTPSASVLELTFSHLETYFAIVATRLLSNNVIVICNNVITICIR